MIAAGAALLCLGLGFPCSADLIGPTPDGTGTSMQEILDQRVHGSVNALTGISLHAVFQPVDLGSEVTVSFVEAHAGHKHTNNFGFYDPLGTAELLLFEGVPEGSNEQVSVTFTESGGSYEVSATSGADEEISQATFQSTAFGFYLDTTTADEGIFYSENSKNPGGEQQILVYMGDEQTETLQWQNEPLSYTVQDAIVTAEDLMRSDNGSDSDFNDLLVLAQGIVPWGLVGEEGPDGFTPEPHSLAIWVGIGLLMMLRRKTWRR
jgi:hypothetical protein